MRTRREFSKSLFLGGSALLMSRLNGTAIAQSQTSNAYKAILLVTMRGGNDANNLFIPMDSAEHAEYAALRTAVAIPQNQCNVLSGQVNNLTYGLHPSLTNVSRLYNQGQVMAVANVGPLLAPITKNQLLSNPSLFPQEMYSHPAGLAQWESASTIAKPSTGWGGRIADLISQQSGQLPPVMNAGSDASIFTAGRTVQGVVLAAQANGYVPVPSGLNSAILAIANDDSSSPNQIVAQTARLRIAATSQQLLLAEAQNAGASLGTPFPATSFGQQLKTIASVINGRSTLGASRQIFYCQQGNYDLHVSQMGLHSDVLSEFDGGIGAFMQALGEMGLTNQVLICTHSDFNRTMIANGSGGTDHGWGTHQLIIGGGIRGGRIVGTLPELALNGSSDLNGYGIWVPTLSATQMTAGVGSWMGLSSSQLASVFPDLSNFPTGAINLT